MKPSKRIEQIKEKKYKNGTCFSKINTWLEIEAMKEYLDEEYKRKNQNETKREN